MENIDKIVDKKSRLGIRRGWVSPITKNRASKWSTALGIIGKNFRDYCENSSLVGYRYLTEPNRSWIERVIWIVLHASTLCMLGLIVYSAYREYKDVPVVTVVDSDNYPTHELDFPGIAICNINRISRKAATELANKIVSSNVTNLEFEDVLSLIRQFGALYDTDLEPDIVSERNLNDLFIRYYDGDYDVTHIMKSLSPTCTDGLSSCHFRSELKNCSEIFEFRKTQDGFCCTFNYVREADDIPLNDDLQKEVLFEPFSINSLGLTNGLTLVLEPFPEDYYFPIIPIIGWKVTVFNAQDYPDNQSGSVSEALLSPATETFIELDVKSFYSTDDIQSVPVEKRKCIFKNELPVLYAGYTYSDCLVDCRAAAIWETCKCRPFFLPRRGNDEYKKKVCDTGDTQCLHSHKDIYWSVLSDKVKNPEEESNNYVMSAEAAKHCSNCFPACNDVTYYLHSSKTYLDKGIYNTELLNNMHLENQSVVHIYFTKHGSVRLKQEAAYYWYELLSNIGGICGVFIGFSLISVVELLYFTLCILREFCRRPRETPREMACATRTTRNTRNTRLRRTDGEFRAGGNAKRFTGTLYWNEFLAHSGVTMQEGKIQRLQVRRY